MLPEFGHNSQVGFVTPARHASQNHGSVEHDDTVLDTLAVSDTPQQPWGKRRASTDITFVKYAYTENKQKIITK